MPLLRLGICIHRRLKRQALVLDLMELQRPIVDRKVLEFVQAHTFRRRNRVKEPLNNP